MLCSLCRQDNRVWHHLVHLSWNDVLLVLRRGRKRIKHHRGKKTTTTGEEETKIRTEIYVSVCTRWWGALDDSRPVIWIDPDISPFFFFFFSPIFVLPFFGVPRSPGKSVKWLRKYRLIHITRCGRLIRHHAPRFYPFLPAFHATPLYTTHDLTPKNIGLR